VEQRILYAGSLIALGGFCSPYRAAAIDRVDHPLQVFQAWSTVNASFIGAVMYRLPMLVSNRRVSLPAGVGDRFGATLIAVAFPVSAGLLSPCSHLIRHPSLTLQMQRMTRHPPETRRRPHSNASHDEYLGKTDDGCYFALGDRKMFDGALLVSSRCTGFSVITGTQSRIRRTRTQWEGSHCRGAFRSTRRTGCRNRRCE
jgi:hypothetical protein